MNTVITGSTVTFAAHDRGQTSMPINSSCGPIEFKAPVIAKDLTTSDTEINGDLTIHGKTTFKGDVVLPLPPSLGIRLDELQDLVVENPKNGHTIQYDEAKNLWVSDHIPDANKTGFAEWDSEETNHITIIGDQIQVNGGFGYIDGELIEWSLTTVPMAQGNDTSYICVVSDGGIIRIPYGNVTEQNFTKMIPLFLVSRIGDIYVTVGINCSYTVPASIRYQLIRTHAPEIIHNLSKVYISGQLPSRTVGISPGLLSDFGMETTIASNNLISWTVLYKPNPNEWSSTITKTTLLPNQYVNEGVLTNLANNERGLIWLGVLMGNGNVDLPQYILIMQSEKFLTQTDAISGITNGNAILPDSIITALRPCHLGWVIVNNNNGSPHIEKIIPNGVNHLTINELNGGMYGDGGHNNLTVQKVANRDPLITDSNFKLGSIWVNSTTKTPFQCTDNSPGATTWKPIAHGTPSTSDVANTIVVRDVNKAITSTKIITPTLTETGSGLVIDSPSGLMLKIPSGLAMTSNAKFYHGSFAAGNQIMSFSADSISFGLGSGTAFSKSYMSIAVGKNALGSTVTNDFANYWNMAIGEGAMQNYNGSDANGKANENIAIGLNSMMGTAAKYVNAMSNVAIGPSAMKSIECVSPSRLLGNIAIGAASLGYLKNDSTYNIAIGHGAGKGILTGSNNVAIGKYSTYQDANNRTDNTMIGLNSGYLLGNDSTGNVALGSGAMNHATLKTVTNCIAIGRNSGTNLNNLAENCILIGTNAGSNLYQDPQGIREVISIGNDGFIHALEADGVTDKLMSTGSRSIVLGSNEHHNFLINHQTIPLNDVDCDFLLGYDAQSARIYRTTPTPSRRIVKQNITPIVDSSKVLAIQPVTYQYKKHPNDNRFGFIVEDVAPIIPEMVRYEVVDGKRIPFSLQYENLTALLVHFLQKLHARVRELEGAHAPKAFQDPNSTIVKTNLEPQVVVQVHTNHVLSIPMMTTEEAKNELKKVPGDCTINFRKPGIKSKVYWVGTKFDGLYYEREVDLVRGIPI